MSREGSKQTLYKLNGLDEGDMARISLGLRLLITDYEKRGVSEGAIDEINNLKWFIDNVKGD